MKKQLLIAFLMFTAIPCVATETQQSNKAELLAHLKNIKSELNEELKNFNELDETFQQNSLDYDYYLTMKKFWNDCQSILTIETYTKIINELADFSFNRIYNEMIPLGGIEYMLFEEGLLPTYAFVYTITFNQNPDKQQQKTKKQLYTIFKKHFKKYLLEIPSLENFLLIPSKLPVYVIPFIIDQKILFPILLEKIDAKIIELETQI